jgi:hypothetical protein
MEVNMSIDKIKKEYEYAKEGEYLSEGEQVRRNMLFIKLLMADNSPDVVTYHYNLLKERDYKDLYYDIRAAFEERDGAEEFLINKISTEVDPITLGDILHLLGILKSSKATHFAREIVNCENNYQREVALYVLGWLGNESDITILNEHLLSEQSSRLRITAASAHRQIYFRLPELKDKLLTSLKQGFEKETDDEVITWIIIMIESIALKRFGLREDREDPYIVHGDLQKAKIKAAKYLAIMNQ